MCYENVGPSGLFCWQVLLPQQKRGAFDMGTETWDRVRNTRCARRDGTVVFLQLWKRTAWGWRQHVGAVRGPHTWVCGLSRPRL